MFPRQTRRKFPKKCSEIGPHLLSCSPSPKQRGGQCRGVVGLIEACRRRLGQNFAQWLACSKLPYPKKTLVHIGPSARPTLRRPGTSRRTTYTSNHFADLLLLLLLLLMARQSLQLQHPDILDSLPSYTVERKPSNTETFAGCPDTKPPTFVMDFTSCLPYRTFIAL
ncbi:hypothetical protein CIHG_03658 [Coccidioides immitis H538.4]|uniref:Uncharacterized protein n=3 Tax=Coccidioides immitis TaxID=5501 RepID=A0A0J8R1Z6_COCIT|nr:hypothetical protein CIRG_04847 [Coccidioides immitis RMSCC 2394]KMU77688.1 hypothetical protein CISG_01446 [Coccidioides immitis RMSCC 3703]KMU85617.1 hypothetical protein CIHG_03658 [Coccidioides immitis H538.4]